MIQCRAVDATLDLLIVDAIPPAPVPAVVETTFIVEVIAITVVPIVLAPAKHKSRYEMGRLV